MQTPLENEAVLTPKQSKGPLGNPLLLLVFALIIGAGIYFVFFHASQPVSRQSQQPRLPFGATEQAYAPKLKIENLKMSTAENFLQQEVKIVSGDLTNSGDTAVAAVEATIEFQDSLQQNILRETRAVLPVSSTILEPGKTVHFDISFDHVPNSWNYQMPIVQVSGIQLARH